MKLHRLRGAVQDLRDLFGGFALRGPSQALRFARSQHNLTLAAATGSLGAVPVASDALNAVQLTHERVGDEMDRAQTRVISTLEPLTFSTTPRDIARLSRVRHRHGYTSRHILFVVMQDGLLLGRQLARGPEGARGIAIPQERLLGHRAVQTDRTLARQAEMHPGIHGVGTPPHGGADEFTLTRAR